MLEGSLILCLRVLRRSPNWVTRIFSSSCSWGVTMHESGSSTCVSALKVSGVSSLSESLASELDAKIGDGKTDGVLGGSPDAEMSTVAVEGPGVGRICGTVCFGCCGSESLQYPVTS